MVQIDVDWEFTVRDARGKLTYKNKERGNSALGNFIGVIWPAMLSNHPSIVVHAPSIDTGGVARSMASNSNQQQDYSAIATFNDRGVVLGTGIAVNTIDTKQLDAIIAHGVTAGTLVYGAMSLNDPVVLTNPRQFTFSRLFGGNNISAVVVQEAGFISYFTSLNWHILIERSLITPFNIPALGAATAVATFSVSI